MTTVQEFIAGDCCYHDPVFPNRAARAESMQRHIYRCRTAFTDLKFAIANIVAEEDEVTLRWTASATQAAEFLEMQTAHRSASIEGTSIYRIGEGKIVEQWVKWNLMSLMRKRRLMAVCTVRFPAFMLFDMTWLVAVSARDMDGSD